MNLLPAEKPLVNCVDSDEAGFSDGCLLEDLAQGSTHTIYLRPGDPDGEAQEWSVGVFTDRQSERVSVRLVEPRALISDVAEVTGTYEGSVQFIDPAGRAMMNLPVRAEVLGQGDAMKMRLIDELRILSPTGSLWGRPVDGGFTFHWTRYLGERAQGLGDVEVHLALRSQEALSVGAGRCAGGALTSPSPVEPGRGEPGVFWSAGVLRRSRRGQLAVLRPDARLDRHQGASGDRGARRPDVVSAQRLG